MRQELQSKSRDPDASACGSFVRSSCDLPCDYKKKDEAARCQAMSRQAPQPASNGQPRSLPIKPILIAGIVEFQEALA